MRLKINEDKRIKSNWKLGLCNVILFLYVVLGNASTINMGGIPFKIPELLGLVALSLFLISYRVIKASKISLLYIIWFIYGGVQLIVNSCLKDYTVSDAIIGLLYCFRMFFSIALIAYCSQIYKNCTSIETLENILLKYYIVVCFLGFAQLIVFPVQNDYVSFLSKLGVYFPDGWDPHIGRLVSTYIDPNYLGSILALPFAISLKNYFLNQRPSKLITLVIIIFTVLLTNSRSGFLAVSIVVLYMLLIRRFRGKTIKIQTLLLFMISGIIVLFAIINGNIAVINRIINLKTDPSALMRFANWSNIFEIIKDNWILGIGYNGSEAYFHLHGTSFLTDSSTLVAFMCTGIVGVILWLYINILIIVNAYRNELDYLSAFVISALITSNFNNLMFNVLYLIPVILLVEVSNKAVKVRIW